MVRSLKEKIGTFPARRRIFPTQIENAEAFSRCVDLGVLDCFEPEVRFLSRQSPIITLGSCFAENIANYLAKSGYSILPLTVLDRLFTPFALQSFVENLGDDRGIEDDVVATWKQNQSQIDEMHRLLRQGNATVIITLGLSIVWYDKETDEIIHDPTDKVGKLLIFKSFDKYEMRQTSLDENVDAIAAVINGLRAVHPSTRIILTLSPVPIQFSGCDYPVVAADCISKSTLRVAIDQITRLSLKDVYYYPSFELLKWLAPMVADVWFEDKMITHVRKEWIDYALAKFEQLYCVDAPAEGPPVPKITPKHL